jgi:hypothetical protein
LHLPFKAERQNSALYARDFNNFKEAGSATRGSRTADQSQFAQLWAGSGTPTTAFCAWNNVDGGLFERQPLNTVQRACAFLRFYGSRRCLL